MSGRTCAVVLLMLLCVGCGRPDPGSRPGTLPPLTTAATPEPSARASSAPASSASATPTPAPTSTGADLRAVTSLYLDWSAHYLKAQQMAAGLRRAYLRRWLVDPALSQYVDLLATSDEQYVRVRGPRVSHVIAASVTGTTAHVEDCTDVHRQVLVDTRTGRAVGKRLSWVWTKAALTRTGRGWRIAEVKSSLKSCVKKIGATP
ncbi:MAG TPA: hypothetical protein VF053_07885 [Streptosporangiales bacterium]